jgi:pimeloyl-ACP methyl ester carboxylesterase
LIDSIKHVQEKAFIHWVTYDLDLWESSAFNAEKRELVKEILNEKLDVFKTHQFPDEKFPTIIYHHGNGGISFENAVLFEYLASHGYVIISADYHWPGLRLRSYTQKSDLSLEDVDFITNFSENLSFTNHQNLRFIGHSWGGGVALRLNQKGNPHFKHYLIFDSTIEKMVLPELKALYPHFDSLIRYHPNDFKTESTVITARASYYSEGKKVIQPYPEFLPFKLIDTSAFTFFTLKSILNHGSFTSVEVMRASLLNQFDQSDSVTIKEQYDTYQYLVQLTKDLLSGVELDEKKILIQRD